MARIRFFIFLISAFFLLSFYPALAQKHSGEVININHKYRVAFTDLTEAEVQAGDKVGVRLTDGRRVMLDAVEVYPVMVKLSIPSDVVDDDLNKIVVGAAVQVSENRDSGARLQQDAPSYAKQNTVSQIEVVNVQEEKKNVPVMPAAVVAAAPQARAPQAAVVARAPQAAQDMPSDGNIANKMDRLVMNNLNLSDHITRLLSDSERVEKALKDKEQSLQLALQKIESLVSENQALAAEVGSLRSQLAQEKERDTRQSQTIVGLEAKLDELKKKLARMGEIINKQMKAYE